MKPNTISKAEAGTTASLTILLLLIMLAYSNTFNAAWHLDDNTNILDNKKIQVSTLSLDEWSMSMRSPFHDPVTGKPEFYRPVAMLSFAVNWYLGGSDVIGYHLVNIGIHCINAVLLYFLMLNLLHAPNMNGRYQGSEHFIALLVTALWALHPVQTQAITYIVQRMASLATLFYLLGMYAFVKGKNVPTTGRRWAFYGLCLVSFLLALGSKQNAVTLPVALLLIEFIFYSGFRYLRQTSVRWILLAAVVGMAVFFILVFYFWSNNPLSSILAGYQARPFTLPERVMTEFRVLVLYIWQIFYPIPQQFSIIHDIELSTSPIRPWTTMPSIVTIGSLIIGALAVVRKNRLLAFAILFYFLGHSVESTIFPLELVFEHRNYLPTFFLFIPLASGLKFLLDRYRRRNMIVYGFLVAFVSLMVVGLGFATYIRNMAWATEKTLWQDAMQKAPSLARPHQGLALALERENQLDSALHLYEKALELKDPVPKLSRFISFSNMGNIYKKRKAYDKAVHYLTAAVNVETGIYADRTRYNLVLCLLNSHNEDEALKQIETLISRHRNNGQYFTTKGFILFQRGEINAALQYLRIGFKQNPDDNVTLLNLAMVLSATGDHERADQYLQRATKRDARNIVIYLGLLQNAIKMQDAEQIHRYLHQIMGLFRLNEIESFFTERAKGYHYINATLVPVEDRVVLPYLTGYLKAKALELEGVGGGQISEFRFRNSGWGD